MSPVHVCGYKSHCINSNKSTMPSINHTARAAILWKPSRIQRRTSQYTVGKRESSLRHSRITRCSCYNSDLYVLIKQSSLFLINFGSPTSLISLKLLDQAKRPTFLACNYSGFHDSDGSYPTGRHYLDQRFQMDPL